MLHRQFLTGNITYAVTDLTHIYDGCSFWQLSATQNIKGVFFSSGLVLKNWPGLRN